MDRYSIDDAVADGATVPIYYTGRKTESQADAAKLDVLFDEWFAGESDEHIRLIKERGVTVGDLVRLQKRIDFPGMGGNGPPESANSRPRSGAVVLYKRTLDRVIGEAWAALPKRPRLLAPVSFPPARRTPVE